MSFGPIDKPAIRRSFLAYDLEWLPSTMRLRLVGVYDSERGYRRYTSVAAFLDSELTHKNRGRWFYAHAGGLADIQYVLDEILRQPRGRYQIKASFSGSSAIIVHIRRGHNVWHFVDSFWTLKGKLADLGQFLGMPKGHVAWDAPLEELAEYNEQDCRILWHAIAAFEDFILRLGGQLQMTLASTALGLFRRAFLRRTIATSAAVNARLRPGYFGGRVEVIDQYASHGYTWDINSCYPHAMTRPLPGALLGTQRRLPRSDALYFALVDVRVRECHIPPLPYRLGEQMMFPTGRWSAWVCGEEIDQIIAYGHEVERVHEVLTFEPFDDCARFVDVLYARRCASRDEYERFNLKILLNSLYGKFGERPEKEAVWIDPPLSVFRRPDKSMWRPGVFLVPESVHVSHEHVPIAAYVTSRARCNLYGYIRQASARPHRVHYCDTDSISTTHDSMPSDSSRLGALKLEKEYRHAHFVQAKLYDLELYDEIAEDGTFKPAKHVTKAKGFPRRTDPDSGQSVPFGHADFERIVVGGDYTFERMVRVREQLSGGDTTPRTVETSKRLRNAAIPKRRYAEDGTSVPWDVRELAEMVGE